MYILEWELGTKSINIYFRMRAWDEIYKYPTGNTLPTIPLGEQTGNRTLNWNPAQKNSEK